MKKIISILVILTVFVMIMTLTACGNKAKDEMTTIKDNGMSMLDDMSSALSDVDDSLTQGGNVTKDNSSTGLFETMTTESTTGVTVSTTVAPDDVLQ